MRSSSLRSLLVLLGLTVLLAGSWSVGTSGGSAGAAPAPRSGVAAFSATAACPSVACAPAAAPSAANFAAVPFPHTVGSTATNWLVANWSGEGMIAEDPANPAHLVAGSLYQAESAFNNSTLYNDHGVSGAYVSFDGGHSWVDQALPSCEFHIADSAVAFGPGDHVVYIDMGWGTTTTGCPWSAVSGYGLFATASSDGGVTWGTPVSIRGNGSFSFDKPWAAVDPVTGEFYVAYTDDGSGSQIYLQNSTDNGSTWSSAVEVSASTSDSMRGVELAVDATGAVDADWVDQSTAQVEFARSTDHGASFTTPRVVASPSTAFASPAPDAFRAYLLPTLAVDRSATSPHEGRIYAAWQNGSGGTAGSPTIAFTASSDNGTHWSRPITVNSDTRYEDFQPSIGVDPGGTVYVDWYSENASNGHYRLRAAVSHDGGASFDPEIAVSDSDSYPSYSGLGNAWWIGDYTDTVADAGGAHPLWTDARATQEWTCSPCLWGYDYNISMYTAEIANVSVTSNVPANLTVGGSVAPGGGTLAAAPGGGYGDWLVGSNFTLNAPATVDTGSGTAYFESWFGAITSSGMAVAGNVTGSTSLHVCYGSIPGDVCRATGAPGFLVPSVTPATASVTLDGAPLSLLAGTGNFTLAPGSYWVNVSAPGFHSQWTQVAVTTANVTSLVATLVPYPGWIAGTLFPGSATLEIAGVIVPVNASGTFNVTLAPGAYRVFATAPFYANYSVAAVHVATNVTALLPIDLRANAGQVVGTVDPAGALVTANGIPVPTVNGQFALVLLAGTYWFNASFLGYDPGSSGAITVDPLANLTVHLVLAPSAGYLVGTLDPVSAVLAVDGRTVATFQGGYNISLAVGTHWANVSASGYDPSSVPVSIAGGATTFYNVTLPGADGWLVGTLNPTTATLAIDGATEAVAADGSFNFTMVPGAHRVNASASGFTAYGQVVAVAAGRASVAAIALAPAPATPAAAPVPLLLGGIVGLLVVAAAVAAFVILRRRRSRPPSRASPAPGARPPRPTAARPAGGATAPGARAPSRPR